MTRSQQPFYRASDAPPPTGSSAGPRTRYAPDQAAIAAENQISDADVLAVIDARCGQAYAASVDTGLTNRFRFIDVNERKRAVERALKSGAVVRTPMGVFRRPPGGEE